MLEDLKNKLTMIIKGTVKVAESSNDDNNEKSKEQKKKNGSGNVFTNLIILFLGGVLLVIVSTIFKPQSMPTMGNKTDEKTIIEQSQGKNSQTINTNYKDQVEKELKAALENIDGVGKVHAMIYFEGGEEQLPAYNSNETKATTVEKDPSGGQRNITQDNGGTTVVMTSEGGSQKPVITKVLNPKIVGVLVTAEGASDKTTELRIRVAVSKLFGLSDNKVEVYPMKR